MSPPDDQSRLTLRYESMDDHPLQHTLTVMMAASHMPLAAPPMAASHMPLAAPPIPDGHGITGKVLELKGQLALLHRCEVNPSGGGELLHRCEGNPSGRGTAAQV